MNQKLVTKFESEKINEEDFKVRGEFENFNTNSVLQNGLNLRLLVKVQSCVRRFLQTSKFLKEHRNNKSVGVLLSLINLNNYLLKSKQFICLIVEYSLLFLYCNSYA